MTYNRQTKASLILKDGLKFAAKLLGLPCSDETCNFNAASLGASTPLKP